MSGQFSATLMFVSLVAIAFATHQASDELEGSVQSRSPAAIGSSSLKDEVLKHGWRTPQSVIHTEKLHGPLHVQLELHGPAPTQVGDTFALKGIITSTKSGELNVDFTWIVPQAYEVVQGERAGQLNGLSDRHPSEVEVTLKKITAGNEPIHLSVGTTRAGARVAETAQFNVSPADSLVREGRTSQAIGTKPVAPPVFQ